MCSTPECGVLIDGPCCPQSVTDANSAAVQAAPRVARAIEPESFVRRCVSRDPLPDGSLEDLRCDTYGRRALSVAPLLL